MKDISQEMVAEAISQAGIEVEKLEIGDPTEFFRKREKIIASKIENVLKIGRNEPLFGVLKDHFDKTIRLCPD